MPVRLTLVAILFCACVRNPATGKLQLDLVPEGQEVQLGQQAKKETEQSIGVYDEKKELNSYVSDLGMRVAKISQRPHLPFSYEVVDDASVNAFALPGGPIFVTRGIVGHLNSEAQLVAVLGHETGHVAARHSVSQMSKAQLAQLGLGVGMIVSPALRSLGNLAGAGLQVLFLKYSRDDETQADQLGFEYMTKIEYDPKEMLKLFEMLNGLGASSGGKLPEWLATHPNPEHRLEDTQARLQKLGRDTSGMKVERDAYLRRLDGIAFGEDPRHGYFKGDLFLHPDLKFQIQLPQGWKHDNLPQAVVAASPQQDGILQLAPGGKESPEAVAQKFFSQQGVKQGQTAKVTIHGLPAVSAYFTAQTDQGGVEGLATFVSHEGMTYAILGYTPAGKLQSYDATFRGTMGSFGPLTDSSALDVKPARLKIVQVPSRMTVQEFNQKYPSSVPIETVALINGAQKDGTIGPGLAKQVTGGVPPSK